MNCITPNIGPARIAIRITCFMVSRHVRPLWYQFDTESRLNHVRSSLGVELVNSAASIYIDLRAVFRA
jgi:hypothetical protein